MLRKYLYMMLTRVSFNPFYVNLMWSYPAVNVHPLMVKRWTEEVFNELVVVYGKKRVAMDKYSRHYRIHQDGKIVAYVHHTSGCVYRPCQRQHNGPHKIGPNSGILWDLSCVKQRQLCVSKVQDEGRLFDPYVTPKPHKNTSKFFE